MIELHTGLPGSGKTASVVDLMMTFLEKHPERPIFTHGIKDIKLPTAILPIYSPGVGEGKGSGYLSALEVDWDTIPPGALVVVDEAQQIFPPRSSGSRVPGYVAWLNTHRHKGIDIILITQHPTLVDSAVSRLVGKHINYRRVFGGLRQVLYEWDHCSRNLTNAKNAVMRTRKIPGRAFAAYQSAELHTKGSFRLPTWMWLVPAGILGIGVAVGPKLWEIGSRMATGQGFMPSSTVAAVQAAASKAGAPPVAVAVAGEPQAGVAVVPVSSSAPQAGASGPATVAEVVPPRVVGCMSQRARCVCYDAEGAQVVIPLDECRVSSRGFDGRVRLAMATAPGPVSATVVSQPAMHVPDEAPPPIDWSQPALSNPRVVFSHR